MWFVVVVAVSTADAAVVGVDDAVDYVGDDDGNAQVHYWAWAGICKFQCSLRVWRSQRDSRRRATDSDR